MQATQSLTLCNNTEESGNIFLLSAMLVVHTGEPYHCTMPPRLSPPVPESKIEVCSPSCVFQLQEINGWPSVYLILFIGEYMYTWSVLVIRSVDKSCLCDQWCIEYLNLPQRTPVSGNTLVFMSVYHIHWSVYMDEISIFILIVFLINNFYFISVIQRILT